jgi:hypothetical protein
LYKFLANVFNFNHFVNSSTTITVTFSIDSNLIQIPNQQLIQAILRRFIRIYTHQLITLSTGVSIQYLRRKLEVVF